MEILIQTCLMPLAIKTQNDTFIFVHELKQEIHADLKYVESIKKEIDEPESDKAEFSNMYDMILQEYLKAQLQDKNIAISELKKLIEKDKGKSVKTKFDKPSVVRQPNAQRIPKPSVLGLSKPVTAQTLPQTARQAVRNTNVLKPGMYRIDNRKSTCFVRDLQGNDLLTDNYRSDLYTISLQESTSSTLLCLMAKASPTQAWLWHRRLSYLNFDYIDLLSKKDFVIGLPKLKYVTD
nr:retrovirus-related Pol polyprotein from transposon TNT 1-94 [Tanacetum cinerariifolium]